MEESEVKIKGNISQEVIDTLISLMTDVIGEKAVNIVLKNINVSDNPKGKDIVYAFAESTTNILSKKASFAILRQVGRELALSIMSKHDQTEWDFVLETTLNNLGFAQKIIKEENEAFICNCVFYSILQSNDLNPIEHAVCWTGWGFIEGFMREIKDIKAIQWVARDNENNRCQFDYIQK
jgi:predicted hydrocarbon binding protein